MAHRIKGAEPNRSRRYELGVIPDVKQLGTELQNKTLAELSVFDDSEIPIIDAGAVEEAPVRRALLAERRSLERTSSKEQTGTGTCRISRIQGLDGSNKIGGIHVKRNRPAEVSAKQGLIVRFDDGDGKAGGKTRDTADLPAIGEFLRTGQHVNGQTVIVAGYEIVGGIEGGKSAAQLRIDRIDLLAVAGSQVQRLAERIADEHLQTAAGVPPADLRGIVRGIADIDEIRVVPEGDSWAGGQVYHAVRAGTNGLIQRTGAAHHHSAGQRVHRVFGPGSTSRGGLLRYQLETERRVSRVRRERQEQMMSLSTYIANAQQIRRRYLALNGEFVVFRVR